MVPPLLTMMLDWALVAVNVVPVAVKLPLSARIPS